MHARSHRNTNLVITTYTIRNVSGFRATLEYKGSLFRIMFLLLTVGDTSVNDYTGTRTLARILKGAI